MFFIFTKGVITIAKRLTEKEKYKIVADYLESGSYHSIAKKYKQSANTIKKIVKNDSDILQDCHLYFIKDLTFIQYISILVIANILIYCGGHYEKNQKNSTSFK